MSERGVLPARSFKQVPAHNNAALITDRSEQHGDAFATVKFAFEDAFEVAQRSSLNDDLVTLASAVRRV
jgi:hypothetical protein